MSARVSRQCSTWRGPCRGRGDAVLVVAGTALGSANSALGLVGVRELRAAVQQARRVSSSPVHGLTPAGEPGHLAANAVATGDTEPRGVAPRGVAREAAL
jgi:hypothetical protein